MPPSDYDFQIAIYACLDQAGTLNVYYASTYSGNTLDSTSQFDLVITRPNWDGTTAGLSNSIIPSDCNSWCGADSVMLTVTNVYNVGNDVAIDVNYSVDCSEGLSSNYGNGAGSVSGVILVGGNGCAITCDS